MRPFWPSQTDLRISKLLKRGVRCKKIAKAIGRPGDLTRVHKLGCNCLDSPDGFDDYDQFARKDELERGQALRDRKV